MLLELIMIDIEEIYLSFLLVKKSVKKINEMENEASITINKHETLKYIRGLSVEDDLKKKILDKCSFPESH